jgi:gas vesicle protein
VQGNVEKEVFMNYRDCTIGFLIGIAAGATVGLLLAPQTGGESRRALAAKTKETAQTAREHAAELLDSATSFVESGRAALVRKQEGLKNAVEAGRKAYSYTTA